MTRNTRHTLQFVGITFFFCWTLIGVYSLSGGEWQTRQAYTIALIYMLIPGITAILFQKYVAHEPVRETLALWFRPNRWFLAAWFLPAVLALLAVGTGLLLPGVEYSPDLSGFFDRYREVLTPEQVERMQRDMEQFPVSPFWIGLVNGLIAGITINAFFALGEEVAWRGFLVHRLAGLGFWRMAGLTGIIWGVWHAPIILMGHNYPQHPGIGVGMMIVFSLLLTPFLLYVRLKSRSTIAAAIFHGTINGLAGLSILVLAGGNDLTVGITGLAGFLA
ncbi:MAG: CPBP family intramembrane glutamic endopeptidase, partial [Candidatus Latescibacterota bacterium]